jgi:hypothetical protein
VKISKNHKISVVREVKLYLYIEGTRKANLPFILLAERRDTHSKRDKTGSRRVSPKGEKITYSDKRGEQNQPSGPSKT